MLVMCAFIYCVELTEIVIPESVTIIGEAAFLGCDKLTNIVIPKSITSINDNAFDKCTALTTVQYTGSEEDWATLVTSVGENNECLLNANIVYDYVAE